MNLTQVYNKLLDEKLINSVPLPSEFKNMYHCLDWYCDKAIYSCDCDGFEKECNECRPRFLRIYNLVKSSLDLNDDKTKDGDDYLNWVETRKIIT